MPVETKPLVVVAEDDATTRRLIEVTVKNAGCEVATAGDGEQALALIRDRQPRVAILDVQMPRMSGWDVARELRAAAQGTRVIFLSSRAQEHDILEGFSAGASDYLLKPFSPRELQARLKAMLGTP